MHFPTFDLKGEKPRKVPAFLYKPKGKGPFPVIIQVHGGPESQYRPGFSPRTQMWVSELGAAVIAPNIRGSSGYDSVYLSLDNGLRREDAIKDIGAQSRAELKHFLGRDVHLFLQVKVRPQWLEEAERYQEMGLDFRDGREG